MPPSEQFIDGASWLSEHSLENEIVLSYYTHGYVIEYAARRPVIIDSFFYSIPQREERLRDVDAVFNTVNLDEAKRILKKYGVTYIFIDEEMKDTLVWEGQEQGLLSLLHNSETFKNAYANEEVEIWKVI